MKSQSLSYLVRLASDKSGQFVGHVCTLEGALAIVKTDAARHFRTANLSYRGDRDTITARDEAGAERTYRLSQCDQPVPDSETLTAEVAATDVQSSDGDSDLPVQVVVDEHGEMTLQTRGTRTPMTESQFFVLSDQILTMIRAARALYVQSEQNSALDGAL
ncbi:hypothetical protein [Rhodococcus coprophilus]|uniref:hypothetical protein n=1 Tax=Rhodococcus coprophilus TaxID=38310 RepID=UPI00340224C7